MTRLPTYFRCKVGKGGAMLTAETTIDSFTGQYAFLSNFHPSPIEMEGIAYPTVEHAFQAHKTVDRDVRMRMARLPTPGQAKQAGREIVDLRPGWEDDLRLSVMRACLAVKFAPGWPLALKLRATGDAQLVEGNTWHDRYWGVCNGVGENHLGLLLMDCRRLLLVIAETLSLPDA